MFLGNAFLFILCSPEEELPPTDRLVRDQFGARRFEWPSDDSVEFHLPHSEMIRLLRGSGFEIDDLIEIQAPPGATTTAPCSTPNGRVIGPAKKSGRRTSAAEAARDCRSIGREPRLKAETGGSRRPFVAV
ncbi:MAG: hypothetical protein ABSC46_00575 [Candidatus Limnocylindrales bacterium]|jgi:hypothetical protein